MTAGWHGKALVTLASSGVAVDDAAQRLLDDGADIEMLSQVEEFLHALDADPSARDRALLLIERTRLLAERGTAGGQRSDGLRAEARRMRREGADEPGLSSDLMRHEVSTPLAVASMALEMLAAQRVNPVPREQLVEVATRNVRLASRLLETWGRAEELKEGRAGLSWAQVDLGEVVRECVADVDVLRAGRHEFFVDVGRRVALPADPDALRQILFNLLTNAAKFSPDGSQIDVTVTATDEQAEVAVRDQGSGISPQDTERIFEAGERGNHTAPGMGLGLFVADQLARAHGGGLHVEDAAGGSRFVLHLPMSSDEWQHSIERREDVVTALEARQRGSGAVANARDTELDRREEVALRRDEALDDREALARDRDAELDGHDEA